LSTIGKISPLKTCFISAPAGARLDVLRASIESRGLRVLVPHEFTIGTDWASQIQKSLLQADLVIGVLIQEQHKLPWVLFELGQAYALGRQIVLITTPKADPVPFALHQFLVLRIDLDNHEAIGFALDQLLSAPEQKKGGSSRRTTPLAGLGTRANDLITALDRSLVFSDWRSVEQVVADALRSSGADVVVTSAARDIGADFAVWSDVLDPFVGNPLLIEVKARIRGKGDANRALQQLTSYLDASGSRWALLLYGEGPDPEDQVWAGSPPNVLILSLRSLFEALRTQAFPELVRDLRNRRVHGASM
jgi:hypothetical protein